jgi:hypothetical protein
MTRKFSSLSNTTGFAASRPAFLVILLDAALFGVHVQRGIDTIGFESVSGCGG